MLDLFKVGGHHFKLRTTLLLAPLWAPVFWTLGFSIRSLETCKADGEKDEEGEEQKEQKANKAEKPPKALSIDEGYVRERLESYLHPTKVEFLDGGQVKLYFDFRKKDKDHDEIFSPKPSSNVNSHFRWTVDREDRYRSFSRGLK